MPTVTLPRDRLFDLIGSEYTREGFDELCFEFGLELDEVVVENDVTNYKVEVPANRYDLLCAEGLAQALRVFLGKDEPPKYTLSPEPVTTMKVDASVAGVRPYIVCAILRDLTLDDASYQSLIDLQEKLHHNICRRRTLVAIGTHDLDTLKAPFSYEALAPLETSFIPLREEVEFNGVALVDHYRNDNHLKQYLHMLEGVSHFPYVLDANRNVASMPPIINSQRSRITTSTKNMLIECTATDKTKANIVLNILIAMFARYSATPHHAYTVAVEYPDGRRDITPQFEDATITASASYINTSVGIDISPAEMVGHLARMQVPAEVMGNNLLVRVPVVRPDLLAACDVMCDVAVGYGFNRIPERIPATCTVGRQQPLNHLSDLIRREGFAQAGYTEVLTWVTVSNAENYGLLRREPNQRAVVLANPKTIEFEECRTSLLPGLLKTLRENRKCKMPIKLFEVGDVLWKDAEAEVGAKNRRLAAAIYCGSQAGFEIIQGLLEHVMTTLAVKDNEWHINATTCNDGAFFDGRRASVVCRGETIGSVGVIHPEVLTGFNLSYPCSGLEINLERFV